MALRKVKDLIREMIFETSSAEHEYAEVMRSFAFDTHVDYDQKLEEAQNKAAKYDKKIQRINAGLDRQNKILKDAPKKKNDYAKDVFKSGMQKLNAQKQSLEARQRETIQQKQEIGFRSLSSKTKKYACLRYLANECIKNTEFETIVGKDGFIYADEHQFKSSKTASDFREISDYVDYIFSTRESKITKPEDVLNIIRADAKSLDIEFEKPNTEKIKNIYQKVLDRIAKENNKKISEKEQIELSQIGIEPVRDFGDGMVMYRLMPDTEYYKEHGEHRNLVYEGNQMGLCIGQKGQAYSQNILDLDKNQYYTLRSKEKNGQLVPHCTIEVNGITVNQVKGNSNGPVNGDYIKQVREFLKNDLNCIFPGEKFQDGKRQLWDYADIGFVGDINNRTVDIFKLPPNTWFNVFFYTLYKLKGVDIENIRTINTLSCGGHTLTQKEYDNLKKIRNIKKISFAEAKLKGIFEFKDLKNVYLSDTDLSEVTEIKFVNVGYINLYRQALKCKLYFSDVGEVHLNDTDLLEVTEIKFANVGYINLSRCGLRGELDFNEIKGHINLSYVDLSKVTEIKFQNVSSINLSYSKLKGKLDFSGVKELSLEGADLSEVTEIKFPNIDYIDLSGYKLKGKLDFSGVKELDLSGADLSEVTEIKFNPNAERIDLSGCKGLKCKLDFSGVKGLDLSGVDLSNVTEIKFNPNAEYIDLYECRGLKDKLDFSGVKKLDLTLADLSNVTAIKFNPKGEVWGYGFTQKLTVATNAVINKFKPKPKIVSKDRENG